MTKYKIPKLPKIKETLNKDDFIYALSRRYQGLYEHYLERTFDIFDDKMIEEEIDRLKNKIKELEKLPLNDEVFNEAVKYTYRLQILALEEQYRSWLE